MFQIVILCAIIGFIVGICLAIGKAEKELRKYNKNVKPEAFRGVIGKSFPTGIVKIKEDVLDLIAPQEAGVALIFKNKDEIIYCLRNKVTLNLKEGDVVTGSLYNYAVDISGENPSLYPVIRDLKVQNESSNTE